MKKIKKLTALTLIATVVVASLVFASRSETINIVYDNIQLMVKGKNIVAKDADGNIVQPFIYNGTTYLPVRAIGEALDLEVKWDGNTKTVSLDVPKDSVVQKNVQPVALYDLIPNDSHQWNFKLLNEPVELDGKEYNQVINGNSLEYNIDKNYTNFSGVYWQLREYKDETFSIYADDKLIFTRTHTEEKDTPYSFDLDITGAKKLKIELDHNAFGLAEAKLK